MQVKLISYTVPKLEQIEDFDLIEYLAFVARVSNPSNQMNAQTSSKLIDYCIKNKHWSVLTMADITVEIEATRDITRQLLRHTFDFQEFSQRYANGTESMGFEISEARLQDTKNRQNSIEIDYYDPLHDEWENKQKEIIKLAKEHYDWAISKGIAKELARKVLPEGLTLTKLYVKGPIRLWIHYLQLRLDKATQKEHRDMAQECAKAISEIFPIENYLENIN